jgi:hypothetical protein
LQSGNGVTRSKVTPFPQAAPEGWYGNHIIFFAILPLVLRKTTTERKDSKMKKHIKDVFARMDLQHIRAFVLTGAKELHPQAESYEVRIIQASNAISKRIDSLYSDTNELDKATTELADALTAFQDVYFEIGMKFGARLVHQLLMTDNFTDRGQA